MKDLTLVQMADREDVRSLAGPWFSEGAVRSVCDFRSVRIELSSVLQTDSSHSGTNLFALMNWRCQRIVMVRMS